MNLSIIHDSFCSLIHKKRRLKSYHMTLCIMFSAIPPKFLGKQFSSWHNFLKILFIATLFTKSTNIWHYSMTSMRFHSYLFLSTSTLERALVFSNSIINENVLMNSVPLSKRKSTLNNFQIQLNRVCFMI